MKTALGIPFLFVLIGLLTPACRAQLPGGFSERSVTAPEVIALANFAIGAKSKSENVGLVKILKAESQVVAGHNTRIAMDVRVDGGIRLAVVDVWTKLDGFNELTKWEWKGKVRPDIKEDPLPAAHSFKVSNVKVHGDPTQGHVDVEFDLEFKADVPSDIVFLCVAAGQDVPNEIAKGSRGNFSGHVKARLSTQKSWEALKNTRGAKPVPIVVHACEVYDLPQAHAWIANHASIARKITTVYAK